MTRVLLLALLGACVPEASPTGMPGAPPVSVQIGEALPGEPLVITLQGLPDGAFLEAGIALNTTQGCAVRLAGQCSRLRAPALTATSFSANHEASIALFLPAHTPLGSTVQLQIGGRKGPVSGLTGLFEVQVGADLGACDAVQGVLDTRCTACHGASALGGLDLRDVSTAVGTPSSQNTYALIEPGHPATSYLLHKLQGTHLDVDGEGGLMPPGGVPLPADDIELVEQWVEDGASCAPPLEEPGELTETPARRLTHRQVRQSVRDLFDVELDPAIFPDESTRRGALGDVSTQAVDVALAESYLVAAETVAAEVVPDGLDDLVVCPDFAPPTERTSTLDPVALGLSEDFIIEYTGKLYASWVQAHTFELDTSGPAELTLNGSTVISSIDGGPATGSVDLTRGFHEFRLRVAHGAGTPHVDLHWSSPNEPYGSITDLRGDMNYSHYELSEPPVLMPDFDELTPERTAIRWGYFGPEITQPDNFAHVIRSVYIAPTTGDYTFHVSSDDGSQLLVDDVMVLDNDGVHTATSVSATVALDAGEHFLELRYFQASDAKSLDLTLDRPDGTSGRIPREEIFRYNIVDLRVDFEELDAAPTEVRSPNAAVARPCAEVLVDDLAPRAWRRPLRDGERDELLALFDEAATRVDAHDALRQVLAGILLTPEFLYLVEDTPSPSPTPLTSFEIAQRLSFLLTDSVPDDLLWQAAIGDTLTDPTMRLAHADRLMASPAGQAKLTAIMSDWLDLSTADHLAELGMTDPDGALADVQIWLDAWLANEGSVADLFSGQVTVPHGEGLSAGSGSYDLGLFGLAGFLGSHTDPVTPPPITRGVFTIERLLCTELPTPPAVEVLVPEAGDELTMRDALAVHRELAVCAGCHDTIDPYGLPLEALDAQGRLRTLDNGTPIDASATLPPVGDLDGYVADVHAYAAALGASQTARTCMTDLGVRLAYGVDTRIDLAASSHVDSLAATWSSGGLAELLRTLIASDTFATKRWEP